MELKTPATWMEKLLQLTHQFNTDVIGLSIPETPSRLGEDRKKWATSALNEELTEFKDADTLEDEVDALIDLCYFALGRVIEMGVIPGAAFEEVHVANMTKKRGELSKRPYAKGFDAVKPEGWTPPYLLPYLALNRQQVLEAYSAVLSSRIEAAECLPEPDVSPMDTGKPKLLIIGHGRHGKDTVAGILRQEYGFEFTSSSLFCVERVIWDAIQDHSGALDKHEKASQPGMRTVDLRTKLESMRGKKYASPKDCFNDRDNFRAAWFSLIAAYCYPDRARLAREIFAENDIYVGLRSAREFRAIVNAGIVDLTIWVDAGERLPAEDSGSMRLKPWMADVIIDNNGDEEELYRNVHQLMVTLNIERTT